MAKGADVMPVLSYFIVTRKLFESAIWRDSPHVLKLFLYLIGMARHNKKPKKFDGFVVKRGELVTSLSNIAEDNEYTNGRWVQKWSRQKVSRMLKKLTDEGYISLLADTYGTHIKVINYDTYQNPKTYKRTTMEHGWNMDGTWVDTYNKDNNGNNEKKKDIVEYPKWLNLELWNSFKKHRNGMKPKLSPHAETLNINKLKILVDAGFKQETIINQTIERGWKGLFEPKEDFNNKNPYELKFK